MGAPIVPGYCPRMGVGPLRRFCSDIGCRGAKLAGEGNGVSGFAPTHPMTTVREVDRRIRLRGYSERAERLNTRTVAIANEVRCETRLFTYGIRSRAQFCCLSASE